MMEQEIHKITVEASDPGVAGAAASALADELRGVEGVLETGRKRSNPAAMDLGSIVQIVAASGATVAIAQGIAAWIRGRRGVSLRIERSATSESVKAAVDGIDPTAAIRIMEIVLSDRADI